MLLARAAHDQVRDDAAVDVAGDAVTLIDTLFRRAGISRHGHPAGIDEDALVVVLTADDGGENTQGDIVDGAAADAGHPQGQAGETPRPEERRVGNACDSKCSYRWSRVL